MGWLEGDIELDGARIHYYRRGRGRPLVLAHGARDSGLCWTRVAEALEPDYDVIAYDARFHGLSEASEGTASAGADLIALVERLGLERPAIMGHSMGAGTVAAVAAECSELFRCAILEDPGWRLVPPAPVPEPPDYQAMTLESIIAGGRERNPMWHADEFEAWARSKQQHQRDRAQRWQRPAEPGVWRETARRITCPLLLLTGGNRERGAIVTPEGEEEAKRVCPQIEVVRFEQAGHNIRREAFAEFVAVVSDFLARHP